MSDDGLNEIAILIGIVMPPAWIRYALCAQNTEVDLGAWFPLKGEDTVLARAICARCPVRQECLDYAVDNGEQYGIWGGMSFKERREYKQTRDQEAA